MPIWKQRLLQRLHSPADDGTGNGGGGGGGDGGSSAGGADDTAIRKAVEEAVAGLKAKNSELLGKLKSANENLARFDGIDPEAVSAMLKRFADDEEAGLIKAGKVDEVLAKRTERMQQANAKALKAEQDARTKAESKAAKLADRTLAASIRDAALKAGALPEALDDIALRARLVWRLNDDGDPVAMAGDEVVLGKDGKTPLTPSEWAETLRETAPHLWPKAQGSNALGSPKNGGRGGMAKKASDMTPAEKAAYIGEHGLAKWNEKVSADYR